MSPFEKKQQEINKLLFRKVLNQLDAKVIEQNKQWISEQCDKGDPDALFSWGYHQLDGTMQSEILTYILDHVTASGASKATLTIFELFFDKGNNKIAAWSAIRYCCQQVLPFPKWVEEYLFDVSEKLLVVNKPKSDTRKFVDKAIGLPGKKCTQVHDRHRHWEMCSDIERLKRQGMSVTEARRKYANDYEMSFDKVRKIHKRYQKAPLYKWLLELSYEFSEQ